MSRVTAPSQAVPTARELIHKQIEAAIASTVEKQPPQPEMPAQLESLVVDPADTPTGRLLAELKSRFGPHAEQGPGGWRIVRTPAALVSRLGTTDILGWRADALPKRYDDQNGPPPAFACEFLRQDRSHIPLNQRLLRYLSARVQTVWFAHPLQKTITVYTLGKEVYVKLLEMQADLVIQAPPFEAVEIPLSLVWPQAPAPSPPRPRKRRALKA